MHSLKIVIDLSGDSAVIAFNAGLFFSVLRASGANPLVTDDGLYCGLTRSAACIDAYRWAGRLDPDGTARAAYAHEMWNARPPDTRTVLLG